MELLDAINLRHSARAYLSDTPSKEVIEGLMAAAARAPCAFNRQAWRFTVILNRDALDKISDGSKDYMTRTRPLELPEALYEKLADPDFHVFHRAPALIVISTAAQGPWIEADGALAAENLMLAAQAQGLGSCWIGLSQPFLATPEGRALAQLPQNETPVAPLVVGRPAQTGAPTPRQPVVARWIV
jgi:nitroreductase